MHPHPVEDWTVLLNRHSIGKSRWLYFQRKYALERLLGIAMLVPVLPIIFILCILVRLTSPGPGLYRQTRVGYRGKHFQIIKIRTMRTDAESDGIARWCVKGDARITWLGRIIRKLHLDELPQLINLARGEMTLVGPRPERPCFVQKLKQQITGYERRLSVMPGITGLAQINLPPDETLDDARRKQILDLQYIEEACYWLDFRMLLATSVRLLGVPGTIVIFLLGLYRKAELPAREPSPSGSPIKLGTSDLPLRVDLARSVGQVHFERDPKEFSMQSAVELVDPIPAALTVDVEDYFHVSAFEHQISREAWSDFPCRVEANTDRLLALFDDKKVSATFFILGWVADRYPELIRRIADQGHEIGCHSYWHRLVYNQSPSEFREDLCRSRDAIENACGVQAKCYRAPSFSITSRSMWAINILIEEGFTVDSSIFPIKHDRYGVPNAKSTIHIQSTSDGELIEFPPSVWQSRIGKVPVGGGYFRLMPLWLTNKAIHGVRQSGNPGMFYIHPWEIDPRQPRIANVGQKNHFRHYVGQKSTYQKLGKLLDSNRFASISHVLSRLHVVSNESKSDRELYSERSSQSSKLH